jgi:hypothetical protein
MRVLVPTRVSQSLWRYPLRCPVRALVASRSHVLLDLHLHERLGEY